jgi:protease IV
MNTHPYWRLLGALALGFGLPVLACYGLVITLALAFRLMTAGTPAPGGQFASSGPATGPAVAVIRVEGLITSGEASPFSTDAVAAAGTLVEQIDQANADPDVKSILLYVNSPGGGVTASDVIFHALKGVDKPIVVLMGDLAASGGYYISMASDWIIANPNTLTGSIGVISEFPNADGLLEKVGVDFVVITSGPRKDFGSPYREMTSDERQYWQTIIDEAYTGFVAIVADGRGLPVEQVLPLADGRVYTGRQALDAGLIDALGYEADAIAKAAELGGITGQPRLIEYTPSPGLLDLLSAAAEPRSLLPTVAEVWTLFGHPRLEAKWVGQ